MRIREILLINYDKRADPPRRSLKEPGQAGFALITHPALDLESPFRFLRTNNFYLHCYYCTVPPNLPIYHCGLSCIFSQRCFDFHNTELLSAPFLLDPPIFSLLLAPPVSSGPGQCLSHSSGSRQRLLVSGRLFPVAAVSGKPSDKPFPRCIFSF